MLSYSNNIARIKGTLLLLKAVVIIMNNLSYVSLNKVTVAVSFLSLLVLSGCQSLSSYQSGYKKIENADEAKQWAGQIIPLIGEVNIACAGTYHCEITKIDNTAIISTDTHKPVNPALVVPTANTYGIPYDKLSKEQQARVKAQTVPLTTNNSVKIIALSSSGMLGLTNYYASVKPIKREVHINFYPENNTDYVERFALIDEFKEEGTYLLQAYQQKPAQKQDSGSLLDKASPASLCIDFLKDQVLQRRFCKNPDSNVQGEFVELTLANKSKNNKS